MKYVILSISEKSLLSSLALYRFGWEFKRKLVWLGRYSYLSIIVSGTIWYNSSIRFTPLNRLLRFAQRLSVCFGLPAQPKLRLDCLDEFMKRKTKRRAQKVYNSLLEMSAGPYHHVGDHPKLHTIKDDHGTSGTRMKKFRFQQFHQWLATHFEPCRVADIGGGKGLLSYLLQKDGWKATVIDPAYQDLPDKYKNIISNKRVKIAPTESVPHITGEFQPEMARDFDLLVGLHAHGVNVKIIDAAAKYGKGFVLVPCCIIDEPVYPRLGVSWLECLTDYAIWKGCKVHPFQLKFSGQNIGIYALGNCVVEQARN